MRKRIVSLMMAFMILTAFIPNISVQAAAFTPRYSLSDSDCSLKYWAPGTYGVSNGFPRNWNSGYAGGNCTWYAFGRAWELLGTLPKLCTNNAGAWYNYNKNYGYYAYGSTPKLGAIACWDKYDSNNGHVAVVEEIGSDYIVCSESGWSYKNSYFSTQKRSLNSATLGMGSSYRFLGYIYIGEFSTDTVHPTITNIYTSNVSGNSFTVNCTLNDNIGVTRVWLNVYGPGGSKGYEVAASNGNFSHTINTADYGGEGLYSVHIYAFDAAGNETAARISDISVKNDTEAPQISNIHVSNISSSSFTVNCTLSDNVGVTRVWLNIYGPVESNGYEVSASNGDFAHTVNTADYGGAGNYTVHIYAFDNAGNERAASTGEITIYKLAVNSYTVSNITNNSFVLNGNTNYPISRAYIIIYGPGGNSGNGFDIYDINGTSFSKKINISDYGGQGSYIAHLYVFDSAGNSAPAATERFYVPQNQMTTPTPIPLQQCFKTSKNAGYITIKNDSDESQSPLIIIAEYDNERLRDITEIIEKTFLSHEEYVYHTIGADMSRYKVFVWDSFTGMRPLAVQ